MYTVLGHAVREGLSKEVTLSRDLDRVSLDVYLGEEQVSGKTTRERKMPLRPNCVLHPSVSFLLGCCTSHHLCSARW